PLVFEDSSVFSGTPDIATALIGKLPTTFDPELKRQQIVGQTWPYQSSISAARDRAWSLPFQVIPNYAASTLNAHTWGLEFRLDERLSRMVITELRVGIPPELEAVLYTDGLIERDKSEIVWRDLVATLSGPASVLVEFTQPIQLASMISATYTIAVEN